MDGGTVNPLPARKIFAKRIASGKTVDSDAAALLSRLERTPKLRIAE